MISLKFYFNSVYLIRQVINELKYYNFINKTTVKLYKYKNIITILNIQVH
jgi:hypothetical protein